MVWVITFVEISVIDDLKSTDDKDDLILLFRCLVFLRLVEWPNSAFNFVDTFAKQDYSHSVEECLGGPSPAPPTKPDQRTYRRSYTVASKPVASMTPEEREEARRNNRWII